MTEGPPRSSLDEDAGPGSQGEIDPGSEGDFTGEPMKDEAPDRPNTTDEDPREADD